ncbi:extracelular serine peptidase [Grosmannia clavigera kw1407]|uniref:Extracelular serine peptidase n=1 Tax=Grosmannia clavigera (strain kw1407 / UAMH 11150) TaxID=655863 RepID=F0XCJ4_GROCL|nr:extracelular serine peptidase [Grosmannia clavigera kw1407]EFX03631.1 extracelular serine peptidase [Grosmannia clavigera kw1407]
MRPVGGALLALAAALFSQLQPGAGLQTWQPIRHLEKQIQSGPSLSAHGHDIADEYPEYPAHVLRVPIDHFHNDSLYEPHVDGHFDLRYWFDDRHYRPGGPVIVLAAGETSGADRLPFLRKGIAAQLAAATHGLAVILEHRYYGASFPLSDLSTASLRFLRTEQALADTAYFARHVRFPGLAHTTPGSDAPWIIYGGSYAGAFAAFARILYPDVFWGAISSSGVTVAIYDYWQYFEAQRLFSPPACVNTTQTLIHAVDQILRPAGKQQRRHANQQPLRALQDELGELTSDHVTTLKTLFNLANVTHDDDFAALLSEGLAGWQDTNWDPAVSSPSFGWYCGNVTADTLLFPELEASRSVATTLLAATTYSHEAATLADALLNFAGWVRATFQCADGRTQDQCFSNRNATFYRQDDLSQHWRAWPYQYCTQWGYLATGSGVPNDRLPLISRLLDLEYLSIICRDAFGITGPPDVESVNRLGGFDIQYPRLAIVDGEADPWRAATPHALVGAKDRPSTTDEPFWLIGGGAVHHWDENGLLPDETSADLPPQPILDVQAEEVRFVKAWVDEWTAQKSSL